MKIEGHYTFQLPIQDVYEALRDEALLREAIPGNVHFKMTSPTEYEAAMQLDVPRFGGAYSGQLTILETKPPTFYRLQATGQGPERPISAAGIVELIVITPEQTEVRYQGRTDALADTNRFFQMAAAPIAAQLANRGLRHLERMILERKQRAAAPPGAGA